jgi:mRNA-degrading endonuclease RelE of RelBE toxin-antitoxin system
MVGHVPPRLAYRKRHLKCAIRADERQRLRDAVERLPAALSGQDEGLNVIGPLAGTRHRDLYRLRVGDLRVIFRRLADELLVLEIDRRDDHTYADLDRLAILRRGNGVEIVDLAEAQQPAPIPSRPVRVAARPTEVTNPLTVFATTELQRCGLSERTIQRLRLLHPETELAGALAPTGIDAPLLELVADMWQRPDHYSEMFASGQTPLTTQAAMTAEELSTRLEAPESATEIAALSPEAFEAVLRGSIEEWMVYLHPSQLQVATHRATGPSRVRGGPGTGKTVALLHRAKHLVAAGDADRVLLTTFVNVLPATWDRLLATFAPAQRDAIRTATVDRLVVDVLGRRVQIVEEERRRKLLESLLRRDPLLAEAIGGLSGLEREFDSVISGRGAATKDEYLQLRVRDGSMSADRQREGVWDAYERYRAAMRRLRTDDFPLLRLEALAKLDAEGPPSHLQYDAVLVDEAQDLTAVQIEILKRLDVSDGHRCFMLAGDQQQSIYPGGFRLADVDLDVRGRAFVLRTNWRNTQAIDAAASAALGDAAVPDDDLGIPQRDRTLPRRLGSAPELWIVSATERADALAVIADDELRRGIAAADVAVLARTNKLWQEAERALLAAGVPVTRIRDLSRAPEGPGGVAIGTFEGSKGLEFKSVVLFACDSSGWAVTPTWLSSPDDRAEWWQREVRKLFVAMTRARDRLIVLSEEPLPRPLDRALPTFDLL